jgi:hypothetical protein
MGAGQPVGPAAALPAAAAAQTGGTDPTVARALERATFRALEGEQSQNRDGSFFGGRLSGGPAGPGLALEAGAYGALALALRMHRTTARLIAPAAMAELQRSLESAWISPVGEVGSARGPRAFASFSWRSVGGGVGLTGIFAPPNGDDLVGWAPDQCSGSFDLEGIPPVRSLVHRERLVAGGFTTTGQIFEGARDGKPALVHGVSWTALPVAGLAVLLDLTIAAQPVRVNRDEGLQLSLANDLFNGNRRVITCDDGRLTITGVQPDAKEEARIAGSRWLNVDGRLGAVLAYGQQPFTLRDFSARDQNPTDGLHSMLYERLDCPYRTEPVEYGPGQVVRDTAIILVAGDTAATKLVSERSRVAATGQELLRAVRVVGPRGHQYLLIANFSDHDQTLRIRPPGEALAPLLELRLGPLETQVIGE